MKKILISFMAILLPVSMIAQNSAVLKLNPEKNKVYRMKSLSDQTVVQSVNGNQQTVSTKVNYVISLKTLEETSDFLVTEIHFDTISTNTNSMGKIIEITSSKEGNIKSSEMNDVMSSVMNKLSKTPVFAKLDFTGKVIEVVNIKMISDQIAKDTSAVTLTGPVGEGVKKQIVGMVSDNAIKTIIEMFTRCLPAKEVRTGETWSALQTLNSGGMSLDITTSYYLDAIKDHNASITAEAAIKTAANAEPIRQGGATVTYDDLKGLSKSAMIIDTRTGLVLENKSQTHLAGNLGVSGPGFSMQLPMDINGESKIVALQ
jgi:hypothetical protein